MKTFKEINKIMLDNQIEEDGVKCDVVTAVRYELMETAEKRGSTYDETKRLEYCGLPSEDFERLCYRVEELYCKTEDPEMTISRLTWAVVKLYEENRLDDAYKWDIYELASKYDFCEDEEDDG